MIIFAITVILILIFVVTSIVLTFYILSNSISVEEERMNVENVEERIPITRYLSQQSTIMERERAV